MKWEMKWKLCGLIYFVLVLSLTPGLALAYIDPSVTSYAIQAIAGVVVAIGAFVAIFWRRAKKKVQDKLGVDLEANKEHEEDVQVYDNEQQNERRPS